jgi:hypothetical protein
MRNRSHETSVLENLIVIARDKTGIKTIDPSCAADRSLEKRLRAHTGQVFPGYSLGAPAGRNESNVASVHTTSLARGMRERTRSTCLWQPPFNPRLRSFKMGTT